MADGRVTIKTNVDDRSLKDLRSSLKDLESAFKALQQVKPFDGVAKDARDLMNEFTGVSSSANKAEQDIDSIDGQSIDDVSKKASDAGSSLEDTAQSADKADTSIDDIDGKSMEDVTKKASDASGGLDDTATSADKADASLDNVDGGGLEDVSKEADKAGKSVEKADKDVNKFSFSLKDVAKSAVVISAVSKVFDILSASLDDAISRFDTLNRFPRTMNLLGYETAVVDRSTRSLVRGIEGLPTKLDDIIQTTQRLGGMSGDLDDATETALALNNAFLASGSSAMDASRGTEQYIQMLGNGKVDMQSWRTLTETMNYALIEAANSFGYTGPSALQQFYSALQSGEVTFNEFNQKMQELNKAQGGFAELALTNSEGIATSWQNIKTAVSRNVANIIVAIDDMVQSITGKNIAQNLNNFKFVIDDVFGVAITTIKGVAPVIEIAWKAFKLLLDILKFMEPVIWGVVSAFVAFKVITTTIALWQGLTTAIGTAQVAMQLFSAVAVATGNGMLTLTGIKAGLAAVLGNVAMNAGVATGAMGTMATGITVLKGALAALTGPIGWVVAGIGLLVAGGVAIYKTFVKASDETQALGKSLKDTAGETAELNDLVDQTASSYQKTKEATEAQFDSIRQLASETAELAEKEKLSAGEKKILKDNIEELNGSVDNLGLAYDEEQGRLVASNDAMLDRIKLAEEDAKFNDIRERRAEIEEQHAAATDQLAENEKALAEAQEHLDGLKWYQSSGEAKEGVEELKEENARLTEQIGVLADEQLSADEEMQASAQALAEAEESANSRRISSMEQLSDSQRQAVESMQERYQSLETTTTEMFDKIEGKSKVSIEQMNENLLHNQEMVANWSANLATLSEQGVDQGLLEQLARLGPEGAPYVQELVDATPEQLSELEANFTQGAEVAKQGLFDTLGLDESDVIEGIPELATRTSDGLRAEIEASGLRSVIPDELSNARGEMEQAGEDVALGVSDGIKRGSKTAADSSRQMAKDVNTGFTAELMIQSPSQVFINHGLDIGEGLTQGIKTGGSKAITAIKLMALEINKVTREAMVLLNKDSQTGFDDFYKIVDATYKKTVSTVKSQTVDLVNTTQRGFRMVQLNVRSSMTPIPSFVSGIMNQVTSTMFSASSRSTAAGRNLGMGFYYGLRSTQGSIYSLATTIATNAVNRINRALQTRSPSKKGRESGANLGKGVWLGMKSELRNVEKWADELGHAALLGSLKPAPLGMGSQFLTGAGNQGGAVYQNSSNQDNRVFNFNANANGTEKNDREFYERLFREFKYYIKQEGGALNN